MKGEILYSERQFLGRNQYSINRRLVLAIFCFVFYYLGSKQGLDFVIAHEYFFYLGVFVLLWSIGLMFILHLKTEIRPGALILNGIWTSRLVKVDLNSIVAVEQVPYSRLTLNRPVYNLHRRGIIRFYCSGRDAIKLTDRDGLIYLIGTQRPSEFYNAVVAETGAKQP
ncbi:MAG: hypothetical protein KDC37_07495 [Flavobacteriales bacterium]|jgi:hypothetical protein|nr:hypothetical protein [Flavobacteriales bacterium]